MCQDAARPGGYVAVVGWVVIGGFWILFREHTGSPSLPPQTYDAALLLVHESSAEGQRPPHVFN